VIACLTFPALKSFTSLPDELLFIDYNTRWIFAYKRAADALVRILPLEISHPVAYDLLVDARNALLDFAKWKEILFRELNTERFFFSVRPYYKPYRVGLHEYRGANAGTSPGSTRSICCWAYVMPTTFPTRSCWSINFSS
jgi:Domain of unknown function (DUF1864)